MPGASSKIAFCDANKLYYVHLGTFPILSLFFLFVYSKKPYKAKNPSDTFLVICSVQFILTRRITLNIASLCGYAHILLFSCFDQLPSVIMGTNFDTCRFLHLHINVGQKGLSRMPAKGINMDMSIHIS